MTTKEKQVILKLLGLYKQMPFLWNTQHRDYKNKECRSEGHRVLLEIYKHVDPNATVKTLGKKIQNLRTNYMKELDKVLAAERAGEEVYVPTLWYFDAMSFLGNRVQTSPNVTQSDPWENVETSFDCYAESIISSPSSASSAKKLKKDPPLENPQHTKSSENDDRWEAYGKTIGYQVKDLSEHQLIICQKLISDAIFYANLNKLNENSHIVNPNVTFPKDGTAP